MNPLATIVAILIRPVGIALRGRRAGVERSIARRSELTQTEWAICLLYTSDAADE